MTFLFWDLWPTASYSHHPARTHSDWLPLPSPSSCRQPCCGDSIGLILVYWSVQMYIIVDTWLTNNKQTVWDNREVSILSIIVILLKVAGNDQNSNIPLMSVLLNGRTCMYFSKNHQVFIYFWRVHGRSHDSGTLQYCIIYHISWWRHHGHQADKNK